MFTDKKIAAYSKIVAGLPDVPSPALSALQLKQWFDTAPEEIRVAFNALIDNLISTATGDSGAESIGIEPIVGVSAANVQGALEQLRLLINDATAGAIPDGSLGPAKLSFDPATQVELDAHAADFTTHVKYALTTGAANTYAVTLTPAPTSYVRGMGVSVEINALNTGTSTININGLGARTIKKSTGSDVAAGSLKVGTIYTLRYNGTNFILQGEGGEYGTAVAAQVLAPNTIGTDAGLVAGMMVDRGAFNLAPGAAAVPIPAGFHNGAGNVLAVANLLAGNIKEGVTVGGVAGTLVPAGNPIASGSATSDNVSSNNFTGENGTTNNSGYAVTVGGLSLPSAPKFIYLSYRITSIQQTSYFTIYDVNGLSSYSQAGISANIAAMSMATNVNGNLFRMDGVRAYATTTGFRLPTLMPNVTFEWKIWT